MKKEYICPFCFNKHKMHEVKFLCKDDNCKEEDSVYSNYWEYPITQIRPTVTDGPKPGMMSFLKPKMPLKHQCRTCSKPTGRIICHTCHSELPISIADFEDHIFAVIGAKESGKSHYVSILINEIMNGRELNTSLLGANDETLNRFRLKMQEPIFTHKRALNVTQSAATDSSVKKPLLFTMKFQNGSKMTVVTLSIFDSAGEDLKSQKDMEKHTKYISNASGIICLLDPLQIQTVRDEMTATDASVLLPTQDINSDPYQILSRTNNLIRQERGVNDTQKIKTPIAVSFSKTDALEPLIHSSNKMLNPGISVKNNVYQIGEYEAITEEMDAYIRKWTAGNLPTLLEMNFEQFSFFGVSALGHTPDGSKTLGDITSYRVLDPFLWLLWKHGILKGE